MRKTDLWTPSNQPQFSRRNLLLGGVGLGAIGLLAACGSDTNSSNGAADSESGALTSLTAGVLPIVDVAAIYIASTQGIFQNHGLDIDMTLAQGGAAVVPGVVAGDFMFGFSNLTSLLIARSRGLNLKTVAQAPVPTDKSAPTISAFLLQETAISKMARISAVIQLL